MSYPNNFFGHDPNKPKTEQEQNPSSMPRQDSYQPTSLLKDYGPMPLIVNIEKAAMLNTNFRTALWTGKHLQLTLMNIKPNEDIGLEIHPDVDQYLMIMSGRAKVMMGKTKDNLNFTENVFPDYAIFVPANTWHNLVNIGNTSLKLFTIYAPPEHPWGTVHRTKADAEEAERNYGSVPTSSAKFIYTEDEDKVY